MVVLKRGEPRDSQLDGTVFHECLTRMSCQGGERGITRLANHGGMARIENTESWRKRMIRGPVGIGEG